MTTVIKISGGVSGNIRLRNAITSVSYCDVYNSEFWGFELHFSTKKEARKALWEAYKQMRKDDKDVDYRKEGVLYYDASKAMIINH
jgi:hypothetical protein